MSPKASAPSLRLDRLDPKGGSFELVEGKTLVLGRDPNAGIPLADPRASRRHAEVRLLSGQVTVADLGSANGTLVNGRPIFGSIRLEPGDLLTVGDTDFRLCGSPPAAPQPTPARVARAPAPSRRPAVIFAGALVLVGALVLLRGMAPQEEAGASPASEEAASAEGAAEAAIPTEAPPLLPPPRNVEPSVSPAQALERLLAAGDLAGAQALVRAHEDERHLKDRLAAELDRQAAAILHEVAGAEPAAAARALRAAVDRFPRGTAAHARIAEALLELPIPGIEAGAAAATAPDATEAPGPGSGRGAAEEARTSPAHEEALALIEEDLRAGRLVEAEPRLAALQGQPTSKRIRREVERAARILGSFRAAIAAAAALPVPDGSSGKVPLAADGSQLATLLGASPDGLRVQREGGVETVSWRVLPAATWKALAQKGGFGASDLVHLGRVVAFLGDRTAAETLALRAHQAGAGDVVQRLLADARELPEVPEGGFVLRDGAWLTQAEADRADLAARIEKLCYEVLGKNRARRAEAVAELRSLGDSARSRLHRALLLARGEVLAGIRAGKAFAGLARVAQLRAELDALRDQALDLIFDETRYPYPYRPPAASPEAYSRYQAAQKEIDELLRRIESAWKDKTRATIPDALRGELAVLLEVHGHIQEAGFGEVPETEPWLLHLPAGAELTVQNVATSAEDRERIDLSEKVLAENESDPAGATPAEREQTRITNRYRLMMGRTALRLHPALVRAAHGHSDDMSRLGFFSHTSQVPGKESMSDRVAREGFASIGLSENIAVARSAGGAHAGWLRSSGHHRNILEPAWRLIGVGNAGDRWTQNFSIAERRPEGDPTGR